MPVAEQQAPLLDQGTRRAPLRDSHQLAAPEYHLVPSGGTKAGQGGMPSRAGARARAARTGGKGGRDRKSLERGHDQSTRTRVGSAGRAAPRRLVERGSQREGPLLIVEHRSSAGGTDRPRNRVLHTPGEIQLTLGTLAPPERDARGPEAEQPQHRLSASVRAREQAGVAPHVFRRSVETVAPQEHSLVSLRVEGSGGVSAGRASPRSGTGIARSGARCATSPCSRSPPRRKP